jgi:hypothetical protein
MNQENAMSTSKKVLLVLGAAGAICVLAWVALIGAVYALGGVMTVRIDQPGGPDLAIPIPMAIVDAALASGEAVFLDLRSELDEYEPLMREILEVIEDCPDMTFVEVEDGGDHVRVSKSGGTLRVEVRERGRDGVNVQVSLPTRSIARLVS